MTTDYAWRIRTKIGRDAVCALLEPFRPFRVEVQFSNTFNTREFGDEVKYPVVQPLAKLHYFEKDLHLQPGETVLDVGCHLGYYGHHFIPGGCRSYLGIEPVPRIHDCATLLRNLAGLDPERFRIMPLDFSAPETAVFLRALPQFQVALTLASANNMRSLTAFFTTLVESVSSGGRIVIEYLAALQSGPICQFYPQGYRGDSTLYWIFSERFCDQYMAMLGCRRSRVLLEWENPQAIGDGMKKVMTLYEKSV